MYIFKNAWLTITRNKGRNILIGLIVLVIGCACTVTLAIKDSADTLINSYESVYDLTATIGTDRSKLMGGFNPEDEESKESMKEKYNDIDSLTEEEVINYADSKYITSYYYTSSIGVNANSLEATTSEMKNDKNIPGMPGRESSTDFTLKGYSSLSSMEEFINGSYTINDGEVNTDFESLTCLINSELAQLNSISVGNIITISDPNNSSNTIDLTVSGIYTDKEESSDNRMNMFSSSSNTIITNVNVINKLKNNNSDLSAIITPTFVLTSIEDVEDLIKELQDKGMSEYLTLTTNQDQVESATESVRNVRTYVTTFLIITMIIGAIVLFILNMINVRERKYEIGVLRTIGMKKSKLALQFMTELVIVSFAALIIGAGIGSCLSVPISNKMLEQEINSTSESMNEINKNFGGKFSKENMIPPSDSGNSDTSKGETNDPKSFNGIRTVEAYDSIDAAVNFKVLFELLGIGLLLTIISSLASIISIERFSPLTILKERS